MIDAALVDARHMRRALALARRAEGRTAPNPIVGSVIVDARGRVLAEGWHRGPGTLHGEADALEKLGRRAAGATIYVTLEPCAHRDGGRISCASRVVASGARRLVYGHEDPYPGHGGGAAEVARAGIRVDGPVLREACARANAPFLTVATAGRVHVTLKAAMTLDGRIATVSGASRWITGDAARRDVHLRRDRADAILVGVGTVLADDPELTTRGVRGGRDARRVVIDPQLRTPPSARVLPALLVTARDAPARRRAALEKAGAEILVVPTRRAGDLDLRALTRTLASRRMLSLFVEGGAETHAAFLAAGLCDRLLLYVAPKAVGGRDAPSWLGGAGVAELTKAPRFRWVSPPKRLGDDFLCDLEPVG